MEASILTSFVVTLLKIRGLQIITLIITQLLMQSTCIVYGQPALISTMWKKTSLTGVRFYGHKMEFQSGSNVQCASLCAENAPCLSFSVQLSSTKCFIFSERVVFGVNMQLEECFEHYWKIFDTCPVSDGYLFNVTANVCFKPVKCPQLTWNDASLSCQQDGGHLYISNTETKRNVLYNYIMQNESCHVTNPAKYFYQLIPPCCLSLTGNTITFSVKICFDVMVLLSASNSSDDPNVYEIVIGGWSNTRSVIRKQKLGDPWSAEKFHSVLSCNEWRSFYIKWQNGVIDVGSVSTVSNSTGITSSLTSFMTYTDPQPTLVSSLFYSGFGPAGQWHFDDNDSFYTGGNNLHAERTWAWLDGTHINGWSPDLSSGRYNIGNCLVSKYLNPYVYAYGSCNVTKGYICQIPLE